MSRGPLHPTFGEPALAPIPIPEIHISSPQSNRGFQRPILAQSPRPRRDPFTFATNGIDDDDVILPDTNFVLRPDKVPGPPRQEPVDELRDILLCEAEDNFKRAENEWREAIERQVSAGRRRMMSLIAGHSDELTKFDIENRVPRTVHTSPQQIRVIGDTGNGVVRARVIGAGIRSALANREAMIKRKALVDGHVKEILALKMELDGALENLQKQRMEDLVQKREKVQSLGGSGGPEIELLPLPVGDLKLGRGCVLPC